MEASYSLERHCYDVCHCDWRLTIYDCIESDPIRIIYIINIVISALVSVVGVGILLHRIVIKGHTFFDHSPKKGFLRPKPIDSMLLFLTLFNILRLVTSAILVSNAAPDNMIFRSYIFEAPWQFGYWSFTLYLIGIAQTLSESHKSISNSWLPSPRAVDIIGMALLCSPFISNTLSLVAGILAKSNPKAANICVQLQYLFWSVYIFCVTSAVLYCGSRLIQTLNKHLKKFNATGERYKKVKTGIFKIRSIMGLIAGCLFLFGAQCLLFGAMRDLILKNNIGNIFLCAVWNLLAPGTTVFVEASILFSPHVNEKSKILSLKSSSTEQTTNILETQNAMKLNGGMDMSFQDTLTHGALDSINIKYENALNKFNRKPEFNPAFHDDYEMKPNGLYIEDIETPNDCYELKRQDSRVKLINKKY